MSGEYWARHASWHQRRYTPSRLPSIAAPGYATCPKYGCYSETQCEDPTHWPMFNQAPPTKDPMNDSLKLAYSLNLTTWKTVVALLSCDKAELLYVAKANIASLEDLIEALNAPKKD